MTASMHCQCLRSSELPHTTKLYATFLEDFSRVAQFYGHPPTTDGIVEAARQIELNPPVREAVVEILRDQNKRFGGHNSTERNLDRLAHGACAVVTGQQVALFSGPSFSFYKALSAIRLANELTERGIEAVPVFWLATEDHDLAEVNHCSWLTDHGIQRFELPFNEKIVGRRVGEIALGEAIGGLAKAAAEALEGPAAEVIAKAIFDSYRPAETLGSSFGLLIARLFADRGIILLDPLDARLHRLAAGIYRQAIRQSGLLAEALQARTKALEKMGYQAQVKTGERNTLLFVNLDGFRVPLRRRNDSFAAGQRNFSMEQLEQVIESAPETLSANVLLRPVVQDSLLPTAAYIGGPAEVVYFAQAEVVYRQLRVRMPAIVPRAGFTLVEPETARLLKKYGLEIRDFFRGRQRVRTTMERHYLSRGLAQQFTRGGKSIGRVLKNLREPLDKLDPSLTGALDTAERKMLYQFEKLRGKAGRTANFRTGVLDRHERALSDALYPHHELQERTLSLLPFLARHGLGLLAELEKRAMPGGMNHQILFL